MSKLKHGQYGCCIDLERGCKDWRRKMERSCMTGAKHQWRSCRVPCYSAMTMAHKLFFMIGKELKSPNLKTL